MAYMNVLPTPKQICDSNGDPLNGGKVYLYDIGGGFSSAKATYPTYDDAVAATNANAHPVVLDSAGRANIWISGDADIRVRTSADVIVYSEENINPDQSTTVSQVNPGRLAPAQNLAVNRSSVTAVAATADKILLLNSSDASVVRSTMSLSIDITASGANGLDTGSEANSTWYYIYAIWNGTTLAGLLSTSASSPTLPSGYTYKALLGAVYNDSAGNFDDFVQRGNRVAVDNVEALTNGTASSYTSIDLSAIIPSIANEVFGSLQIARTTGTGSIRASVGPINSSVGESYIGADGGTGTGTAETRNDFSIIITTAQTMYYNVATADTSLDVKIAGYSM